ncbi:dihydrodipicolinate synthase family protein [Mycolicibacterium wolinskyi]|nr:dihydrodipicolinate synthase family protein [Mycolicibacterium wolinskyi]
MTATQTGITVTLPLDGEMRRVELGEPGRWRRPEQPITSRIAYAAAHVVPRTLADNTPGAPADLDWDATLAYRHELWSYGLGVADAMDTAQRGMGLDWAATRELIRRSGREAAAVGGRLACGAGTDQLVLDDIPSGSSGLATIIDAYREQVEVVRDAGAQVILMASRALARVAQSPADYLTVYNAVLSAADQPVILHWLGDMFDPALRGYWGSDEISTATKTFLDLIGSNADKVDGVKVSLLDADHEIALRRALPPGVRLYTGDDFNYPELIVGDEQGHSDALLGIFAAIYPAASTALQELDAGNVEGAGEMLESTRALGRHIFAAPTYYYKTGIAFLSWLNGNQPGFAMVGGLASGRSVGHLARLFALADRAGLLTDPALAAHRMQTFLELNGVRA